RRIDCGRRACSGPVSACAHLPVTAPRLVSFRPAAAAFPRSSARQERRSAVRGREILLCCALARSGPIYRCARAGAGVSEKRRGHHETVHARRPCLGRVLAARCHLSTSQVMALGRSRVTLMYGESDFSVIVRATKWVAISELPIAMVSS